MTTGKEVCTLTEGAEWIDFDPHGKFLATSSWYDETVKLWDVTTWQKVHVFSITHPGQVVFSPREDLLVVNEDYTKLSLWDVGTKEKVRVLSGGTDFMAPVAFSPDGSLLASGSSDGAIKHGMWPLARRYMLLSDTPRVCFG